MEEKQEEMVLESTTDESSSTPMHEAGSLAFEMRDLTGERIHIGPYHDHRTISIEGSQVTLEAGKASVREIDMQEPRDTSGSDESRQSGLAKTVQGDVMIGRQVGPSGVVVAGGTAADTMGSVQALIAYEQAMGINRETKAGSERIADRIIGDLMIEEKVDGKKFSTGNLPKTAVSKAIEDITAAKIEKIRQDTVSRSGEEDKEEGYIANPKG